MHRLFRGEPLSLPVWSKENPSKQKITQRVSQTWLTTWSEKAIEVIIGAIILRNSGDWI